MSNNEKSGDTGTSIPNYLEKYLTDLEAEGRKFSREEELRTYGVIKSEIEREEDAAIRGFMEDALLNYIEAGAMLLSFIYEKYWTERISKERALQTAIPIGLYIELESIVAGQSDAYAYTKTNSPRRYPLMIPGNRPGKRKVRNLDKTSTSPSKVLESYYQFGSHNFAVGGMIKRILDFLEGRYLLNFKELEARFQSKQP